MVRFPFLPVFVIVNKACSGTSKPRSRKDHQGKTGSHFDSSNDLSSGFKLEAKQKLGDGLESKQLDIGTAQILKAYYKHFEEFTILSDDKLYRDSIRNATFQFECWNTIRREKTTEASYLVSLTPVYTR